MAKEERYIGESAIDSQPTKKLTFLIGEEKVTTAKLADGSVVSSKIADGAVTEGKIVNGAITNGKIGAGAVIEGNIAQGAVHHENLAPESVTGFNIAEKAIDGSNIKDKTIAGINIKDGTIGTDQLSGGLYDGVMTPPCITTEKIADWNPESEYETGVTTDKIADEAVTNEKLANGSITSDKLSDDLFENWQEHVDPVPTENSVLPVQSGGVYPISQKVGDAVVSQALVAAETYTGATISPVDGSIVSAASSAIVSDFNLPSNLSSALVSGRLGATTGRCMIAYFNGNIFLGYELPTTGTASNVVEHSATIPKGATKIRVAGANYSGGQSPAVVASLFYGLEGRAQGIEGDVDDIYGKIFPLDKKVSNLLITQSLVATETYSGKTISSSDGSIASSSSSHSIVCDFELPTSHFLLSVLISGRRGVTSNRCMIAYFNGSTFLGNELPNMGVAENVVDYPATIPDGTTMIRVAGLNPSQDPSGQMPGVTTSYMYGLYAQTEKLEEDVDGLKKNVDSLNSEFYPGFSNADSLPPSESYTYAVIETATGEIGTSSYSTAVVRDFLLPNNYLDVRVSGRRGVTSGCCMIAYFNGDTFLGSELPNSGSSGSNVVDYSPTIPDGTTMIRVAGSTSYQDADVMVLTAESKLEIQKEFNILIFGNSYSYDSFSYIPYIARKNIPYVKLNIAILYQGHCSLEEHLDNINNDTPYEQFGWYYWDANAWTVKANEVTARDALAMKKWDVITFQQNSANSRDYSTYSYLGGLIDAVYERINYPVKIGWVMTHAWADGYSSLGSDTSEEMYEDIAENVEKVIADYPIEVVFPYGTAIQNARGTSLDALGNHLTADGTHLREGIPCLIADYTNFLEIVKLTDNNFRSIIGEQTRPTASWVSWQNVQNTQGSSIGVDEANCLLAQKCAVMASKFPFNISTIR